MKKALMTLLAITLLWSGATTAQQKPAIGLIVEQTDSTAQGCGVSESSLRSIATLTLRNNGISVDGLNLQFISISNIVLATNGCAVYLSVRFDATMTRNEQAGVLQGMTFKPRGIRSLVICEKNSLLTGPSHSMGQRVSADLEQKIKLCLGELIY